MPDCISHPIYPEQEQRCTDLSIMSRTKGTNYRSLSRKPTFSLLLLASSCRIFGPATAVEQKLLLTTTKLALAFLPPASKSPRIKNKVYYAESEGNVGSIDTVRDKNTAVQIGIVCQGGSDTNRPQKVNQDAYFYETITCLQHDGSICSDGKNDERGELEEQHYTCLGVLDGHGLKGHIVSNFFADKLPGLVRYHMEHLLGDFSLEDDSILNDLHDFEETLERLGGLISPDVSDNATSGLQPSSSPIIHRAMTRAFHSAHYAAMQDPEIPAGRNGATCVMVMLDSSEKKLHVAHVGDSRVIRVDVEKDENGNVEVQTSPLSVETTVKIDTEKQRIERGDGILRGNNVFRGPQGIAMTRSLGNAVMLRAGVVPTPIVESFLYSTTTPKEMSSFLVLATDGVWDVLSDENVAAFLVEVDSTERLQTASESIASAARKTWIGDLPITDEEKVDDITCLLVKFM